MGPTEEALREKFFPALVVGEEIILDTPWKEESAKQEFVIEGVTLNFVSSSWYLEAYLGPRDQFEEWVKPQVEA